MVLRVPAEQPYIRGVLRVQKADMAVIDLSITSQRQQAVDFTMPYMNTGKLDLFTSSELKVLTLNNALTYQVLLAKLLLTNI